VRQAAEDRAPWALHRGPAGSTTTIRSMNLTEERYLPGDEALLLR
jgi:hypothetical protein